MAVGAPLPFTSLPPEILLLISENLDAQALVRLSRTCRTLRHFGGCKSVAKAFMRRWSAEMAIAYLFQKVKRMDLIVELFLHVNDREKCFPDVAFEAARLSDLKQLEAWRAEFGFIPPKALIGAARSDRIETVEFVMPNVIIDAEIADCAFAIIAESANRSLLRLFRMKHPEMVTPERLDKTVAYLAFIGRLDIALEMFEGISSRSGQVLVDCASRIANGAAEHGDTALFTEFINMFQYGDDRRDEIAATAASKGRMEFIRLQEGGRNAAVSFGDALDIAIRNNVLEVVEFLFASDELVMNRLDSDNLIYALRSAIELKRTEMLPLLLARVPSISLLHDAAKSESLDDAKLLLGGLGIDDQIREDDEFWVIEFDEYTADVPDWKIMIWLVIMGLDSFTLSAKSSIDEAERARYLSVLPAAIDLVRELDLDNGVTIDEMTRFSNGSL